MNPVTLAAYAKINLTFSILSLLPNGYHSVETVMQRISLSDTVTISLSDTFHLDCDVGVPMEKNLAYKAAMLFFSLWGKEESVSIHIEKKIPMGAGMGGGSADAGAVLLGLNQMFGNPFPISLLEEKASSLGADVPFAIASATALCTGFGEKLMPIEPRLTQGFFLIVKPIASKSTANVYAAYDAQTETPLLPDTDAMIYAIREGDLSEIAKHIGNVFEPLMIASVPEIGAIKEKLLSLGALGSAMTGSGTAVYGLFSDRNTALRAYHTLKNNGYEIFITEPV